MYAIRPFETLIKLNEDFYRFQGEQKKRKERNNTISVKKVIQRSFKHQ